ncbi:hypothetical protein AKG07_16880 [Microbacterium sp. CGR1]|nr:hypothetical protein AKG07_16880 [Microbacterium sp. CGR1]
MAPCRRRRADRLGLRHRLGGFEPTSQRAPTRAGCTVPRRRRTPRRRDDARAGDCHRNPRLTHYREVR